jgi:hypothetical protein
MCQTHHRDQRSETTPRPAKRACDGCGACQRGESCPLLAAVKAIIEPTPAPAPGSMAGENSRLPSHAPRTVLAF